MRIAADCGGQYYRLSAAAGIAPFIGILRAYERQQLSRKVKSRKIDRFAYPLLLAVLLLVGEMALSDRRIAWRKKLIPLLLALLLLARLALVRAGRAQEPERHRGLPPGQIRRRAGAFPLGQGAESRRPAAEKQHRRRPLRTEKIPGSRSTNSPASTRPSWAPGAADFHYNLGNAYFRLGQFPQALESYKHCLRLNPDDVDGQEELRTDPEKDPRAASRSRTRSSSPRIRDQRQAEAAGKNRNTTP